MKKIIHGTKKPKHGPNLKLKRVSSKVQPTLQENTLDT